MSNVIDSSVVLALLFGEVGGEEIISVLHDGHLCAVNLIEILSRADDRGIPADHARQMVERLQLQVHPLDENRARAAAALRPATRHLGLSLGDRTCLALASTLQREAATADRAWATLDIGIPIRLIR